MDQKCKFCWAKIISWRKLCNKCKDTRNYHAAIVSVNKKRLIKKLQQRAVTQEWLDSVIKIVKIISEHTQILLMYK